MGEAKRRKQSQTAGIIYHHTSTLRTNLIWMSGVIELEGRGEKPHHPQLGKMDADASLRREMRDFPPLAWFTSSAATPRCLMDAQICLRDNATGEIRRIDLDAQQANAISMKRVALGFQLADIPVVAWRDHPGYQTPEGQKLNADARAVGDDPDLWYVAEEPVDAALLCEIRNADRQGRMVKLDARHVQEARRSVELCRTTPGAYIPPAWIPVDQIQRICAEMGVPILE